MNFVETALAAGVLLPADQPVILLDRLIDAPRKLVWRMYSDPAHLVAFWGPHGSTTTISAFDFRVGGAWRMVIRFPGGHDVPMNSVFEAIVARSASSSATCRMPRPASRCRTPT